LIGVATVTQEIKPMKQDAHPFDLYGFQRKALPVLLTWSAVSILSGLFLGLSAEKRRKGIGSQFVGWGVINGLIAGFGYRAARKKQLERLAGEESGPGLAKEASTFENILWINAGLDVGYILGGAWLKRSNPQDDFKAGMGVGVQIQGAFLLLWDLTLGWLVHRGRR